MLLKKKNKVDGHLIREEQVPKEGKYNLDNGWISLNAHTHTHKTTSHKGKVQHI